MSNVDPNSKVLAQSSLPTAFPNKKPDKAIYVPPARRHGNEKVILDAQDLTKSSLFQRTDVDQSLEASLGALRISDNSPAQEFRSSLPRNSSQSSLEASIDYSKFRHVIELYDFPKEIETADLQAELMGFEDSGFYLKWVDDTHCLAVFSSPTEAERALKQISGIIFKARRFEDACTDSKRKLARSPGDWAMPYKRRPPTTSATATRLISRHLGLKTTPNSTKSARELAQEDRDRQALKEAREQYEARRKAQKAIWDDESLDFPS